VVAAVASLSIAASLLAFDMTRSASVPASVYVMYVAVATMVTPTVGQYERISSTYPSSSP
jgi:hypothetical protein